MSSDVNPNRPLISYILAGIVDFICLLMAAECFRDKQYHAAEVWLVVGIVAAMIGYYWPQVKPKTHRKQLAKIEETSAFELAIAVIVDTPTNISGLNRRYIQIPTTATRLRLENCSGKLLRVWKWVGNGWEPTQVDEPLDLTWSILDVPNAFLDPHVPRRLNIFFLQNDGRNIHFASDRVPLRMAISSAPSDVFKFDVLIASEENSRQISFKATFGQNWDDITIEEIQ
jgi:hypothetical protein